MGRAPLRSRSEHGQWRSSSTGRAPPAPPRHTRELLVLVLVRIVAGGSGGSSGAGPGPWRRASEGRRKKMESGTSSVCRQQASSNSTKAMMKDQFAKCVVRKVLETCDDHTCELILSCIKVLLNTVKRWGLVTYLAQDRKPRTLQCVEA